VKQVLISLFCRDKSKCNRRSFGYVPFGHCAQDDNFLGKKINARDDKSVSEAGPYFFVLPG
jgi:hypothetical protein